MYRPWIVIPLVNTGLGAVHLELAHSEKKKGYIYAKISIVTTILNVNYTKPKLPPFLNSNPGNGFVDVAKFVLYNDLVKDLPYWLLSSVTRAFPSSRKSPIYHSISRRISNTNTPRCSPRATKTIPGHQSS